MLSREPTICACGDHAFAAITQGYVTLVSPQDAELLAAARWCCKPDNRVVYAQRSVGRGEHKASIRLHRAILPDAEVVDHINYNGLDNRRTNLRRATNSQNAAHRRIGASGTMGVHMLKKNGRYQAKIWVDGRSQHLGYFSTREEAAAVRDIAAIQRWGEFASVSDRHTQEGK